MTKLEWRVWMAVSALLMFVVWFSIAVAGASAAQSLIVPLPLTLFHCQLVLWAMFFRKRVVRPEVAQPSPAAAPIARHFDFPDGPFITYHTRIQPIAAGMRLQIAARALEPFEVKVLVSLDDGGHWFTQQHDRSYVDALVGEQSLIQSLEMQFDGSCYLSVTNRSSRSQRVEVEAFLVPSTAFGVASVANVLEEAVAAQRRHIDEEIARAIQQTHEMLAPAARVVDVLESTGVIVTPSAKCPVCHQLVLDGTSLAICSKCSMPHHEECYVDNRSKCATFGCGK